MRIESLKFEATPGRRLTQIQATVGTDFQFAFFNF